MKRFFFFLLLCSWASLHAQFSGISAEAEASFRFTRKKWIPAEQEQKDYPALNGGLLAHFRFGDTHRGLSTGVKFTEYHTVQQLTNFITSHIIDTHSRWLMIPILFDYGGIEPGDHFSCRTQIGLQYMGYCSERSTRDQGMPWQQEVRGSRSGFSTDMLDLVFRLGLHFPLSDRLSLRTLAGYSWRMVQGGWGHESAISLSASLRYAFP